MRFVFYEQSEIPTLAWCAVAVRGQNKILVFHGSSVETQNDVFVDGVWDGEYERFGFDTANFFCGTGGKILQNRQGDIALFATPSHVLERLCSISWNDKLFLSNSIPFALAVSGARLEPGYSAYERDFTSIAKGIREYTPTLPLKDGRALRLHYYCNVILGEDFLLREEPKPVIEPFKSFDDYYDRLSNALSALKINSQQNNRKVRYGLVTTISRGYDAVASSVMAHNIGCETAVTFDRPGTFVHDCGAEIAQHLGYQRIVKGDAKEYLKDESLIEAVYVSSGELGTNIIHSVFDSEFAGNIVFFGIGGDYLWDRLDTYPSNGEFRFENLVFPHNSHIEDRLRVGYMFVPLPFFGATQWDSIRKIGNSLEMKAYSVGDTYDRPIPRRIIEEKGGIPRGMFAKSNLGAGTNYRFDNLSKLQKKMSTTGYQSFLQYYRANKRVNPSEILQWMRYLLMTWPRYVNHGFKQVGINIRFNEAWPRTIDTANPGAPSYLFPWGTSMMIERYRSVDLGIRLEMNDIS